MNLEDKLQRLQQELEDKLERLQQELNDLQEQYDDLDNDYCSLEQDLADKNEELEEWIDKYERLQANTIKDFDNYKTQCTIRNLWTPELDEFTEQYFKFFNN